MRSNGEPKDDKGSRPTSWSLADIAPLIDELPILLYVMDLDGTIVSANRPFLELIGRSREQTIGLKENDVLSRPAIARHNDIDEMINRTGEPVDIPEMNVVVRGRRVVLEGRRMPLRDPDGTVVGLVGMAKDITATKMAMEALAEEEARYRVLFEEAPIPYMLLDLSRMRALLGAPGAPGTPGAKDLGKALAEDGALLGQLVGSVHMVAVNRALLDHAGMTSDDDFARLLRSNAASPIPQLIPHAVEALIGTGRFEGRITVSTSAGEGRLLDILAVVVPGHEADWSMVLVSVIDVTERDRAERALIETKDRFRTIFEDSPIALAELDLGGLKRYLDKLLSTVPGDLKSYMERHPDAIRECASLIRPLAVNKAFLELHEAGSLDAFREGLVEDLTGDARGAFIQEVVAVAEGIIRVEAVVPTKTLKGNVRFVRRVFTASPGHERDWSRAIMSLDDLTGIVQATEALKESERRFRTMFEDSPVALAEIDFSGVKALLDRIKGSGATDMRSHLRSHPEDLDRCAGFTVMLAVNKAFLWLYEAKDLEDLKRKEVGYLTNMIRDMFLEDLIAMWEGRWRQGIEARSQTTTGREFIATRTFSVVPGHEGDWARVLLSVVDLTHHRWTERKMEEERRSAELYLDLLGHDITNLNQGIIASMELLGLKLQAYPELRHYAELAMRQSIWISKLVEKIRRISMTREEGTSPVPMDLGEVLSSAADRVRTAHPKRDVTINLPPAGGVGTVLGDEMLVEVFVNLLDNAVKFDPLPRAVVDVSVSASADGRSRTVAIADNGPGVPDFMKPRILNRQGPDGARTRGTGLGLTVADHIVRRLGGRILVEDRVPGEHTKGSRFVVELPTAPAPSGGPEGSGGGGDGGGDGGEDGGEDGGRAGEAPDGRGAEGTPAPDAAVPPG